MPGITCQLDDPMPRSSHDDNYIPPQRPRVRLLARTLWGRYPRRSVSKLTGIRSRRFSHVSSATSVTRTASVGQRSATQFHSWGAIVAFACVFGQTYSYITASLKKSAWVKQTVCSCLQELQRMV